MHLGFTQLTLLTAAWLNSCKMYEYTKLCPDSLKNYYTSWLYL